jgi:hypothetical protein
MPSVELTDQEWQQVITIIGTKCTWAEANPLLMKIGQQLTRQASIKQTGIPLDANGQEVRHGE